MHTAGGKVSFTKKTGVRFQHTGSGKAKAQFARAGRVSRKRTGGKPGGPSNGVRNQKG